MSKNNALRAVSFSTVGIALMREEEVDHVLDIERRCNPHPWTRGHFVDALKNGYLCLVAREEEGIVGFIVGHVLVDDAELLLIAVDPKHQRGGCATALFNALVERLQFVGKTPLHLEVRAGNHVAIAFYEARGFVRSGVRKNYYPSGVFGNLREDALLMQKAI